VLVSECTDVFRRKFNSGAACVTTIAGWVDFINAHNFHERAPIPPSDVKKTKDANRFCAYSKIAGLIHQQDIKKEQEVSQ